MIDRRRIAVVAGLLTLSKVRLSLAQPARSIRRIAVLSNEVPADWIHKVLGPPLSELGYEEGRDYTVDVRFSQGHPDRLDALVADLLAAQPDVIVAAMNREVLAARRASVRVPIVMMYGVSPVETGLVASLSRPGGNVTGTTTHEPELAGKMLEVFREAVPALKRVAVIVETGYPGMPAYLQYFGRAAQRLAIKMELHPAETPEALEAALSALERSRPDGLIAVSTGPVVVHVQQVVDFALRSRLPTMFTIDMTRRGALLAYTADFAAMLKRNAWMIDRIFRGARPADMPVELPARFRLSVNLKTARAIGLSLPQSLVSRADVVIE